MEHVLTTTPGELFLGWVVLPHVVLWALGMLWSAVPGTDRGDNPFWGVLKWLVAKEIKLLKFLGKWGAKKALKLAQKTVSATWEACLRFLAGRQGWPRVARWACNALASRQTRREQAQRRRERLAAAREEED